MSASKIHEVLRPTFIGEPNRASQVLHLIQSGKLLFFRNWYKWQIFTILAIAVCIQPGALYLVNALVGTQKINCTLVVRGFP